MKTALEKIVTMEASRGALEHRTDAFQSIAEKQSDEEVDHKWVG